MMGMATSKGAWQVGVLYSMCIVWSLVVSRCRTRGITRAKTSELGCSWRDIFSFDFNKQSTWD